MQVKTLLAVTLGALVLGVGCHRNTRESAKDDMEQAADKTEDAAESAGDKIEDATDK